MSDDLAFPDAMEGSTAEEKTQRMVSHFGMFTNDVLEGIMTVPEAVHVKNALRHKSVSADPALWTADLSHKIDALSTFDQNYLPTEESAIWVMKLLARMRRSYEARSFLAKEHRQHYHWMPRILMGARFKPVPAALASIRGTSCILSGPSGEGKSALLHRLAVSVPFAILLDGTSPAPQKMWVIPILKLSYPPCGTFRGLMLQLQNKLVEQVGDYDTPYEAFSDLLGDRATEAAVAFCTIFNVGILIIDELSSRAVNQELHLFANFIVHLKKHAGIPVVLSGTDAFMHAAGLMGSTSTSMFDGPTHSLLPLPVPKVDANGVVSNNVMNQMGMWYWRHGTFDADKNPPPPELVLWIAKLAAKRSDWFAQGYEALLNEIARKPQLLKPGALTEEAVKRVFESNLRLQLPTRDIIEDADKLSGSIEVADFHHHIDRFKLATLQRVNRRWALKSKMGIPWVA